MMYYFRLYKKCIKHITYMALILAPIYDKGRRLSLSSRGLLHISSSCTTSIQQCSSFILHNDINSPGYIDDVPAAIQFISSLPQLKLDCPYNTGAFITCAHCQQHFCHGHSVIKLLYTFAVYCDQIAVGFKLHQLLILFFIVCLRPHIYRTA